MLTDFVDNDHAAHLSTDFVDNDHAVHVSTDFVDNDHAAHSICILGNFVNYGNSLYH